MQHDLTVDGEAFRLRPITDTDAPRVVELRSSESASRYLHPISGRLEDQLAWLAAYCARPSDYYFAVERKRDLAVEGFVAIYDVADGSAEWGRFILAAGSLAAVETAWLVYRAAFELLDLESIVCRTVADNASVVSFHDSCGISRSATLPGWFELRGVVYDAVEHRLDRAAYPAVEARLRALATRLARKRARD